MHISEGFIRPATPWGHAMFTRTRRPTPTPSTPPEPSRTVPVPIGLWHDASVEDQTLALAISSGDRDAFRILVDRESGPVFRTCYRILGRSDEAEDTAQESFVTAYRAMATYRGEGPLGAWLSRIAVRLSFRRLKQRRDAEPLDPAFDPPADGAAEPLVAALAAERGATVRAAVAELPEPYREIVVLRFFGELQLTEIASATDRPLGTVKTQLRRGLERLRHILPVEEGAA